MNPIELSVRQWLQDVVIGLGLCPFASYPYINNVVRIKISEAKTDTEVLGALQSELIKIEDSAPTEIETTLLILSHHLETFDAFNQFLEEVDKLMHADNWEGYYQVASFHPQYQFANTAPNDTENLTNRAPYPILHIIRESSLEKALEEYPESPESIYQHNILTVKGLSDIQCKTLFPYLFTIN